MVVMCTLALVGCMELLSKVLNNSAYHGSDSRDFVEGTKSVMRKGTVLLLAAFQRLLPFHVAHDS